MQNKRAPELQRQLDEIVNTIVDKVDPEKVILFGSHAWGDPKDSSDIDVFVIKDAEDTSRVASDISLSLYPRSYSLDVLVYRPDRVEWRVGIGDSFIRKILGKGKVLYERSGRPASL